jgi:DNA-directed RNA polymerase subunit K/omega
MPKKQSIKKVKKEESDDEIDEIDEDDEIEDTDEIDEIDEDDEDVDSDNEMNIELETDVNKCSLEDINEDDDEYILNDYGDIPTESNMTEYISKENRISPNRLTKYEMVRILGERTNQLMAGAKPLIKNYQSLSYDKIAEEEFIKNMIPYKIKRPLPNGKFEIWTLDELSKEHLLSMLE